MEELRVYGHYYKLFKGEGGIPREVTVIAIDGDKVCHLKKFGIM